MDGSGERPLVATRRVIWDSAAINAVQPNEGGLTGTPASLFVDANLNQYTTTNTPSGWACCDVNGLTLWVLEATDISQMFVDAGCTGDPTFLASVSGPFLAPGGENLIFMLSGSFPQFLYIGVTAIPATGAVGDPVLLNWIKMEDYPGPNVFGAAYFANTASSMIMVTTDFSTTNLQWWFLPTVAQIIAGTFKGTHPGCSGTLAADQAPSYMVRWTDAQAFLATYTSIAVNAGTTANNGVGFIVNTPDGDNRHYFVIPKAWMESGGSGLATEWVGTHPDGAVVYVDLTPYGEYGSHVWPGTDVTEFEDFVDPATDVTATDFLTAGGVPTIPWSDEWTRILDEGPNDGWFASYSGRPWLIYEEGVPIVFFNIIDGNPTYENTIGEGERVWYARMRAYRWLSGAFRELEPAEGIVFRQGDLAYSNYNFDGPMSQQPFVYDGNIYFQIGQWNGLGFNPSMSILTQFGVYLNLRRPRTTVAMQYHPLD